MCMLQVSVGFGVSRPEHAKQIVDWGAEGVICGSALVKALGESGTPVRAAAPKSCMYPPGHTLAGRGCWWGCGGAPRPPGHLYMLYPPSDACTLQAPVSSLTPPASMHLPAGGGACTDDGAGEKSESCHPVIPQRQLLACGVETHDMSTIASSSGQVQARPQP